MNRVDRRLFETMLDTYYEDIMNIKARALLSMSVGGLKELLAHIDDNIKDSAEPFALATLSDYIKNYIEFRTYLDVPERL